MNLDYYPDLIIQGQRKDGSYEYWRDALSWIPNHSRWYYVRVCKAYYDRAKAGFYDGEDISG